MRKSLVLIVFLISVFDLKSQCAMCKAVVENGDTTVAEGVNNGITYLMVFPYILVGFLLYLIYNQRKKVKN